MRLYLKSLRNPDYIDGMMGGTETRDRCFDHVNVLYLMSNHPQTILHEIPLLEAPTDTPRLKFTVQKTS